MTFRRLRVLRLTRAAVLPPTGQFDVAAGRESYFSPEGGEGVVGKGERRHDFRSTTHGLLARLGFGTRRCRDGSPGQSALCHRWIGEGKTTTESRHGLRQRFSYMTPGVAAAPYEAHVAGSASDGTTPPLQPDGNPADTKVNE